MSLPGLRAAISPRPAQPSATITARTMSAIARETIATDYPASGPAVPVGYLDQSFAALSWIRGAA
jgi:hypothetical protein